MLLNLPESEADFAKWLDWVCQRPLGDSGIEKVRTFARELAEGAAEDFWTTHVMSFRVPLCDLNSNVIVSYEAPHTLFHAGYWATQELLKGNLEIVVDFEKSYVSKSGSPAKFEALNQYAARLGVYLLYRWRCDCPKITLMVMNGYFLELDKYNPYVISNLSFDLIQSIPKINVFISYRRADSSAFALLILARLKLVGLEGFLDLAIQPGENWHAGIRERIQQYDSLVLLLGPTTLGSEIVKQEILWAIEFGLDILPIWHSGFEYKADEWPDLPPDVKRVLQSNHSIRVLDESALGYNAAIVELLNRFGVTP